VIRHVRFNNGAVELAANLHLPDDFKPDASYPAIVAVHPGSGVKEQTAGLYAEKLAAEGFIAISFDASYQGESTGSPRFLENPAVRVEDVRCAVDYLTTLAFVDPARIGVLGICAGGGFAVNAAMTDHRMRAVGVVSVINMGRARREQVRSPEALAELLDEAGRQRTAEARGEPPAVRQWIPASPEELDRAGVTGLDAREAVDYYRTGRG
jgi:fermentation-respiration switch protein FrsA (DUF1100 family)